VRLDILCALQGLVVRHGLHALLPERLECRGVFPEIELRTHEDNGNVRGVVVDFGVPLAVAKRLIIVLFADCRSDRVSPGVRGKGAS
jgi:hypothetical protein